MNDGDIVELQRNSTNYAKVVEDIVKLEKKIFPKHESLARFFDEQLRKKNSGLLFLELDGEVIGYVMYSWPSSLCATIAKLAGSILVSFPLSPDFFFPYSFSDIIFVVFNASRKSEKKDLRVPI